MVWYSHLVKNFPQFVVVHTVKGFGIFNKEKVDIFLKVSCIFGYLNEIPYDYTLNMMHQFKGLDLTDTVPEELCMTVHNILQEAVIKTIPKKKK